MVLCVKYKMQNSMRDRRIFKPATSIVQYFVSFNAKHFPSRSYLTCVCYVIGKSAPANIVRDFCKHFITHCIFCCSNTVDNTIAAITTVLFLFNCRWLYGCLCCRFNWKITNIVANRHDFNRTNVQVHTLRLKSLQPNHAYKHKLDTFNCIHSVIGSTTPESSWRSTYIYIF